MLPSWHCHTTSTCTAIVSLPDRLQQAAPASPSYDYAHKRSQTGRCTQSACAVDCCFRSSQFKLKPAWKPGTRKPTAVLLMPSNQLSASSIQCNTSRTWLENAIRNTPCQQSFLHRSPPLQEHGLQMLATVAAAAQEKSRTSTPFLESNRPVLSGPTRIYATSMPYPYMNVDMIGACK